MSRLNQLGSYASETMRSRHHASAAEQVELRYHWVPRAIGAVDVLFCSCFALVGILTRAPGSTLQVGPVEILHAGLWLTAAAIPFAAVFAALTVETFTVFALDADGVTRRPAVGRARRIRWQDVRSVRLYSTGGTIHLATATARVTFSMWLVGREALASLLLERLPPEALTHRRDAVVAALRAEALKRGVRDTD